MTTFTTLTINNLKLAIHLGWTDAEQRIKQKIVVSIAIELPIPPKACQTDKLDDTVCYDQLIKAIQSHTKKKKYRLIEYLSADIYRLIKPLLPPTSHVVTAITKQPKIAGFTGTTTFAYEDK